MATDEILSKLFNTSQAEREERLKTDPIIRRKLDPTAPSVRTSPSTIGAVSYTHLTLPTKA